MSLHDRMPTSPRAVPFPPDYCHIAGTSRRRDTPPPLTSETYPEPGGGMRWQGSICDGRTVARSKRKHS